MSQRAGGDGAEIVEQSGRYALIRDTEGAAIYDLDLGSDADPVASYPPGDEGFDAAWRRYDQLVKTDRRERFGLVRILVVLVVVGVSVWVAAGVGYGSLIASIYRDGGGPQNRWWVWIQVAETISYHVWVGALALLLLLWLRQHFVAGSAIAPRRRASADRGSGPAAP